MAYIVMDAPGHYGTYATVRSAHDDLDEAIRKARRHVGLLVASDGGFAHRKGQQIHRQFADAYQVAWSRQSEAAEQVARKRRDNFDAHEQEMAKRYGRGSGQYIAAMDRYCGLPR